jgi:transcriptional regulator with XRE-family HTH domain
MIRNEKELRETRARLGEFNAQIESTRRELEEQHATTELIELATEPLAVLAAELEFELAFYERLRTEGVSAVPSYPSTESGKEIVALRIARGWTQRKLAEELGVSEAQVSRDERNDYQGITQERRARILAALGVEEHRAYESTDDFATQRVVIELPVMTLQAARFTGGIPTLALGRTGEREG